MFNHCDRFIASAKFTERKTSKANRIQTKRHVDARIELNIYFASSTNGDQFAISKISEANRKLIHDIRSNVTFWEMQ